MKKYSTNYAIKMLGFTTIATMAIVNPVFCQQPAIDNDLITYAMAVSSDQQVKFRLPKDIRTGDMITGSVIEEKKNNAEGINKTSSTLEGVVIEINGKQTKLSNRLIAFIVPAGLTSLPFLLKNAAGEIIEKGQIPIDIFGSHTMGADLIYTSITPNNLQSGNETLINVTKFSPQTIAQPGQALTVTGSFDGNAANTKVSLNGQACETIAESPRFINVQVSKNATAGVSNLTIEEKNITEEHKINIATLNLTANKTNLRRGEKTTINVTVSGLEGLAADNMNYKLRVENLSPQTISFLKESGNVIEKEINTKAVKNGQYEFSTKIIAQSTGSFSVQALFFKPAGKNPCVDTYYDCIKFVDEDYEYKSRNCTFYATGKKAPAATCQAQLIKEREERKAACLQQLRDCFK